MTPAPPTSYPIFNTPPELARGIAATGWEPATRPRTTPSTRRRPGSTQTGKALDRAGVEHTGSFPSPAARASR